MEFFSYGLWPLMGIGGLLLLISLLFCLYMYRLRRMSADEKSFKMTRYGAFAVFSSQALCPICLEDFRLGERIAKSLCDHSFHAHCLQPWLRQHDTCPMCKNNLKPPPVRRPPLARNV